MNDTPQSQTTIFFAHYGAAMSSWAKVEKHMHFLLIAVLKTEQALASEIFSHIKSTESRIALLDKLMLVSSASEEVKADWKALLPRLKDASTHRNRLAHYQVTRTTTPDGKTSSPVLEPHWKMGKSPKQKPQTYDMKRLAQLLKDFGKLEDLLDHLIGFMMTGKRSTE